MQEVIIVRQPLQFMFMQTLTEIRRLLDERGLRPKHRLGQNFLHDKNQLTKLLDAAEVKSGDVVLEVGPGTGTLTSALLERGAEVVACEIDEGMAGIIGDVFTVQINDGALPGRAHPGSLTLIRGDALQKDRRVNPEIIRAIGECQFKLVANLPYQIASPLMSSLLTDHPNCTGQYVTIQKEVSDRLLAKPRSKEYGPLSIIVQAFAEVKKIGVLSPSCFWPQPEVTSAMVAINPSPGPLSTGAGNGLSTAEHRREFSRFIVEVFSKRRKQLGTILGRLPGSFPWPDGVTPEQRPEALTADQFITLSQRIRSAQS